MTKVNESGSVTFTVCADGSREVFVAGDFNGWNPTATRLAHLELAGVYSLTIEMPKGVHQYKFVIDGVWCADPENERIVSDGYGGHNSIVNVV